MDTETGRRGFLSALAAGALPFSSVSGRAGDGPPLRVQVCPTDRYGWNPVTSDVVGAVRRGVEQVRSHADAALEAPVSASIGRGAVVPAGSLDFTDGALLLESFREWLADREPRESTVHLLFARRPFSRGIGYGRARSTVSGGGDLGAQAVVNLGATEQWDSRAVSRNMAIHETLHALIAPEDARAVNGGGCDHDLGAVVAADLENAWVTPMATSYADGTTIGGETQWHGTGCFDHGGFSRRDGPAAEATVWRHTERLSRATREAATRYIGRELV